MKKVITTGLIGLAIGAGLAGLAIKAWAQSKPSQRLVYNVPGFQANPGGVINYVDPDGTTTQLYLVAAMPPLLSTTTISMQITAFSQ